MGSQFGFSLEYQRGKDNTVADFLSSGEDHLPEAEVEEQITKIPQQEVQAVLDNARIPITERGEAAQTQAEAGIDLPHAQACLVETLTACPAQMTTLHITNWKQAKKEDPAVFTIVENLQAPVNKFKEALNHVLDKKSIRAYVKARENMVM